MKKPVAVNLVPGTLAFSPLNTLLFLIIPFRAQGCRLLYQTPCPSDLAPHGPNSVMRQQIY